MKQLLLVLALVCRTALADADLLQPMDEKDLSAEQKSRAAVLRAMSDVRSVTPVQINAQAIQSAVIAVSLDGKRFTFTGKRFTVAGDKINDTTSREVEVWTGNGSDGSRLIMFRKGYSVYGTLYLTDRFTFEGKGATGLLVRRPLKESLAESVDTPRRELPPPEPSSVIVIPDKVIRMPEPEPRASEGNREQDRSGRR